MENAFATADAVLKTRLDPLSQIFRASAPAFYLYYQAARELVDTGGSPAAGSITPLPDTP